MEVSIIQADALEIAMTSNTLTESFQTDTQRWEALVNRDPRADGAFLYGVQTTGVYCRPTCSSRIPNRGNVTFFATCNEAETARFRPCKRCTPRAVSPHAQQVETITRICKLIEETEEPMSLQTLADHAGLSPYHFHRLFKKIVGITPKEYAVAHRVKRVRQELNQENTVTQAIYEAGFEATSSFYNRSTAILGMTPTTYKTGADGVEIQYAIKPCWLGWILVAATPKGICAIAFGDTPDALTTQLHHQFSNAKFCASDSTFEAWVEQVLAFVETPQKALNLPLDIQGTVFQQQVWKALQTIPVGHTASYAEVACQIGNPKAVRAVARACATNQIAVAIPCHRVVASSGALSGYRWGSDRKRALLERESQ
jgi:AraC family transcriptional regulator, regulatory protein of adaptative response / methylated-DNA-[protein]-cysteine methyltransferase